MGRRMTAICVLVLSCAVARAAAAQSAADAPSANRSDWSGFHAGVNFGLSWLSGQRSVTQTLTAGGLSFANQIAPSNGTGMGIVFGAQAGYDLQVTKVLIGVETDIQGSSINDRATGTTTTARVTSAIQDRQTLNWLGTTRLRLGYVMDSFVPYATGGLAYGGVQASTAANTALAGGSLAESASRSATLLGFAVGGGVDYAIDTLWAVRMEALYYDLGSVGVTAIGTSTPPGVTGVLQSSSHFSGGIVRVGLNLHL